MGPKGDNDSYYNATGVHCMAPVCDIIAADISFITLDFMEVLWLVCPTFH